jgi:cytochrome P450
MAKSKCRYTEFTVHRGLLGCEVNINAIGTARALFLKQTQWRYRPLAALLRSAIKHRVMIVADGEEWERTRAAIMPHLSASRVADDYAIVIKTVADQIFDDLVDRSARGATPAAAMEIEVESLMRVVISSVMGYVLFGRSLCAGEAQFLEKTLSSASQALRGKIPTVVNGAVAAVMRLLRCPERQTFILPTQQRRALKDLTDWIARKIDGAQLGSVETSLLVSLRSRFADREPADQMRCIVAEYVMMLTAGIETTAAALTFAIAEIANNPSVRDEVTREARQVADGSFDGEVLTVRYPAMYRTLRETLRRHTIVPTMLREAKTDVEVRGMKNGDGRAEMVKIRRGSVLRYLPVQGNMRRSIWEQPHRFDPNRFARPLTAEQKRNHHTFGLGPQSCPGRAMAITETILILRAFLRRFDLEYREIAQPIRVTRNALLTIRPVGVTARVRAVLPS